MLKHGQTSARAGAAGTLFLTAVAAVAAAAGAATPAGAAGPTGAVQVVQAVPGAVVGIEVDGRRTQTDVRTGRVVGPMALSPGEHEIAFTGRAGQRLTAATVTVEARSSSDVVLHRPAARSGKSVVSVYRTPSKQIGPGKSRVLIAHTATVPPADVRVDGRTVFRGIANGEFATADIASGGHRVELVSSGGSARILGPVDVALQPSTITMVYAVGVPTDGSMRVIAHTARLERDGAVVPASIRTGTGDLVADRAVRPFDLGRSRGASAP